MCCFRRVGIRVLLNNVHLTCQDAPCACPATVLNFPEKNDVAFLLTGNLNSSDGGCFPRCRLVGVVVCVCGLLRAVALHSEALH